MAFLWVLVSVLLWTESGLTAHIHRNAPGPETTGTGRRRALHTTEGHDRNQDLTKPAELPVALPRVSASQHQEPAPLSASPLTKGQASRTPSTRGGSRRKREPRTEARTSSAAVLGELGKILKDDDTEKKRIPPDVKRQAELKPNDTLEQGTERKQQTFEDWLRDEYFRNMALSIATVKKKRSSFDARRKRSSKHDDAAGAAQEAKLRLQSLENAVLTDALTEIVSRHDDGSSGEQQDSQDTESDLVARRLAQAYYLERLRGAVQKIEEEVEQREAWGEFQEQAEEPEDEEMLDEELYTYQKKDGNSLVSILPVMAQMDDRRQTEEELCPALRMLTSDCASLEEILTEGEMSLALRHACNKHEVCYSCGEAFGLSSSSCDRVFLEDVSSACRSCSERALGKLLVPLRDQRVFYKRSVPPLCYRSPCVQRYLEEHY